MNVQPEQMQNSDEMPIDTTSSQPCSKPHVVCSQSQLVVLIDDEIKNHLDNYKELETVSADDFYVVENDVRSPNLWKPYTGKNFKDKQC